MHGTFRLFTWRLLLTETAAALALLFLLLCLTLTLISLYLDLLRLFLLDEIEGVVFLLDLGFFHQFEHSLLRFLQDPFSLFLFFLLLGLPLCLLTLLFRLLTLLLRLLPALLGLHSLPCFFLLPVFLF